MAVPVMQSISVEVFSSWFQYQEAATRMDVVNALLQMLHPLELRFIASCIDDLTRKDHTVFRESEARYNGENFASDFFDLTHPFCRGKLLVALSLLYSNNYVNACVLYKILLSLYSILDKLPLTKQALDEVLLLFSMAKYHPAFKFDQRATIADLAASILRFMKQQFGCEHATTSSGNSGRPTPSVESNGQLPMTSNRDDVILPNGRTTAGKSNQSKCGNGTKTFVDCGSQTDDLSIILTPDLIPLPCVVEECESGPMVEDEQNCSHYYGECTSAMLPAQHNQVLVNDVEAVRVTKTGSRNCVYEMRVLWSSGEETVVEKSYKEWHKFHHEVLNFSAFEAGILISERKLPYFPGFLSGLQEESEEILLTVLNAYLQQLKLLPSFFNSDFLADFLKGPSHSSATFTSGPLHGVEFTDFSELTICPPSEDVTLSASKESSCDNERESSHYQSQTVPVIHNEEIEGEKPKEDTRTGSHGELTTMSTVQGLGSRRGSFILSCARDSGQRFVPSSPIRGSYDGLHQSLATALLIVRPSPASPSLEKILQTNLLVSRESSPKILAVTNGHGIDKMDPLAGTGAYVPKN